MTNNIVKCLLLVIMFGSIECRRRSTKRDPAAILNLTLPSSETFTFLCQDQMVKVDSNIYHLDRLRSSLKSNYFEKLFTSGVFKKNNNKVLEIKLKNGEVFPSVVGLIHGKQLIEVLNKDNYLPLLKLMNHLEMEIDLDIVSSFIDDNLRSCSLKDTKLFKLYKFIRKNSKFEYLLRSVFEYFSDHLATVQNHKIFSSLPLNHLIRIIKSVPEVDDERRREIVQTCAKWLCHDAENRLPHMVILINSIKPEFHSAVESDEKNSALSKCSLKRKTNFDEKTVAGCVLALLSYGGKLNPSLLHRENLPADYFGLPSWDTYEYEVNQKRAEFDEYEQNSSPHSFVNYNNEYYKLRKFLENSSLYDITVRVGKKSHKLHRVVLESKCGYFADIFRAEYAEAIAKNDELATCPRRDKEYVLDSVDQSAFDAVIDHIYFDTDFGWEFEGVARLFIAADILKIDGLLKMLEKRLKDSPKNIKSVDVVEVLNCTSGKVQYDDVCLLCLCRHLSIKWPEMDDVPQFVSISWSMMENVLKSPHFHVDDPYKILDICSTWISHDIKNRYRFLPRIAQIVNPNCVVDEEKYKTEAAAELKCHSQQFVRDKLWEILSRISYIVPSEELQKFRPKKLDEMPVFISNEIEGEILKSIAILNADMDEIAYISTNSCNLCLVKSATIIDDNLYILMLKGNSAFSVSSVRFLVYNFSLKKSFVLPFYVDHFVEHTYTLLNRNDEVYCCSEKGLIMKFSIELNRWMMISKQKSKKESVLVTSNGEELYRIYAKSISSFQSNCIVEPYNFEKNEWSLESCLPWLEGIYGNPKHLAFINKRDLVVSTNFKIISFDHKSKTWRHYYLPSKRTGSAFPLFVQCKDRMSVLIDTKLYNFFPSNESWELKKEFQWQVDISWSGIFRGRKVLIIHKSAIRVD